MDPVWRCREYGQLRDRGNLNRLYVGSRTRLVHVLLDLSSIWEEHGYLYRLYPVFLVAGSFIIIGGAFVCICHYEPSHELVC